MKKIILLFITLFLFANAHSQTTYNKVISRIRGNAVVPGVDNGYLIAGDYGTNTPNNGGLLIKIDSLGNILWSEECDSPRTFFSCIITSNDSGYLIGGNVFAGYYSNALVVKTNSLGATIWSITISVPNVGLTINSLFQTSDSGYAIIGNTQDSISPYSKIFVAKINKSGLLIWSKLLNAGNEMNDGNFIRQTADSGYILTGYYSDSSSYNVYAFMLKLSPTGTLVWSNKYSFSSTSYFGGDFDIKNDGIIYYIPDNFNSTLIKTDLNGNVLWTKRYNSGYYGGGNIFRLRKTLDGGYVLGPSLIKIDSSWNCTMDFDHAFFASDIIPTSDRGFLSIGNDFDTTLFEIVKTDSSGNSKCGSSSAPYSARDTITSISVSFSIMPAGAISMNINPAMNPLTLYEDSGCTDLGIKEEHEDELYIYPNPSSGDFIISLDKAVNNGNLKIVNTLGQIVYDIPFIGKEQMINVKLKGGIYFVILLNNNLSLASKMIIEK